MAIEGDPLSSQAAEWLAKLQKDDVSAGERAEFERWFQADPAHAVAFARAEFAWERAERLRALPALAEKYCDVPQSAGHRNLLIWPIAAVLSAVAVGALAWYLAIFEPVYATGVGERRTVALADGSEASLNTSSRLEVDFNEQARTVRLLRGEALFKVAHDEQRPFVVHAGETVFRAVGTAFNVRIQDQAVELTVTEGIVAVDDEYHVSAGSAVIAAAGEVKPLALTEDAMRRRVAWRDGVIELKGESLDQAVEEFNRYRKSRLIVADPNIAAIRVGGRFETGESQKFVNALQANFAIRAVTGEDGNVYLFAATPGTDALPSPERTP